MAQKKLKKTLFVNLIDEWAANKKNVVKVELNCHLDIGIYLDITKYLNISGRIFKNVKLSIRDGS